MYPNIFIIDAIHFFYLQRNRVSPFESNDYSNNPTKWKA